MSENSTPEERTEMPTDKRMGELRKEGQMHFSTDLVHVASLMSGFIVLQFMWQWLVTDLKTIFRKSFLLIGNSEPLDQKSIFDGIVSLMIMIAPALLIVSVSVALISSLVLLFQTNWSIKEKWIHLKFSQMNPITGIKRIFSVHGMMNALKAVAKLCLILPIAYYGLVAFAPKMIMLIHMSVPEIMIFAGRACNGLFWKIISVLFALAIFDFAWGKFQWLKQNKMTKEEVKDERKAIDGDEQTKKKIQAKGLQRIAQRIQASVKQADVVITNPTHFAVAIKYDRAAMDAPIVVAKGRGHLAQRIKKIAKGAGIPVLERKILARALYHSVRVGAQIPNELFKAVARVLAYVYRLKNPYRKMGKDKK